MAELIGRNVRKLIVDQLIKIGQVPGQGSYCDFVEYVYPEADTILLDGQSMLKQVTQHCDINSEDWGENESWMYDKLKIYEWSDTQFLDFCQRYVSPYFYRFFKNEENGEEMDLQPKCVDAINKYLRDCGYELIPSKAIGDKVEYQISYLSGVKGQIHGVIFAAVFKPDVVVSDTLNHQIEICENSDKYLIYNEKIGRNGLLWKDLRDWYNRTHTGENLSFEDRLWKAVNHCESDIERQFFKIYLELTMLNENIPAILPQVYLHYDFKSQKERSKCIFDHQCMDFMMLFSDSQRIVIELDGCQHYSRKEKFKESVYSVNVADPEKYANMVKEQRDMTLMGYEVYRFGGSEFNDKSQAKKIVKQFFIDLFDKHNIPIIVS